VGNNALTRNVWGHDLRALLLIITGEFSLSWAGNPNGSVESSYIGRKVWDTTTDRMWICTGVGTASTAEWTDFAELLADQVAESILGTALAFAVAL
jgi:hypothetical protein